MTQKKKPDPERTMVANEPLVLTYGPVVLNRLTRDVRVNERPHHLAPTQFRLLEFLLLNQGLCWSRNELAQRVWQRGKRANSIDVAICKLRTQLGGEGARIIETVRGKGYRVLDEFHTSTKKGGTI
jgi:two-component system OmpR family response regulator